jgi:hypothetical protein
MMERLIRNTYAGFMSEKEIESMLDGKDYWMDAEEWCQRHEQRNKWMEEEVAKFEKKALEALKPPKKPRKKKVDTKPPAPQYDPATVAFKGLETALDNDYLAPPEAPPETKRKVHPAVKEGSISREQAKAAVMAVVGNRK